MVRQVTDEMLRMPKDEPEPPDPEQDEVQHAELEEMQALFRALEKAINATQLYPGNSKIRLQFVDDLARRVFAFLEEWGGIQLSIRENRILYCGEVVYEEEKLTRSLSYKLYRDGIRKLAIFEGLDREELVGLLDVLATQLDPDDAEDDMVTLLWERDFSHLSYYVLEELEGDGEADGESRDLAKHLKRGDEERLLEAAPSEASDRAQDRYLAPKLSVSALSNVLTLTDHDLGTVRAMIAAENARDLRHDLTTLLFEMLNYSEDVKSFSVSVRVLGLLVHSYVRMGNLAEAREVVRRFRDLLQEDLPPSHLEIIRAHIEEIGSGEAMEEIGRILEEPLIERPADLTEFLRLLGPAVLDRLIDLLPRVQNRQILTDLLVEFAAEDREKLLDQLWHDDPAVVQQAITVLSGLGDAEMGAYVTPLLDHRSQAVRLEAVKALGVLGGHESTAGLLRAVRDPEYQVRILALRSLHDRKDPTLMSTLIQMLDEKVPFQRNRYETQEFLSTIARVGGTKAYPFLQRIVEKRKLLGRAENRERRACAAAALAYIDTPESWQLLQKYASAAPPEVRDACRTALRQIERSDDFPEEAL